MAYHHPYMRHEPRHFLPPDVGYEHPVLTETPGPRLPAIGRPLERSADPRYMLSSDNSYPTWHAMPYTLPLRMHHHVTAAADPRGYPGPYRERPSPMLSYDHEYAGHRLQTYDAEIQ